MGSISPPVLLVLVIGAALVIYTRPGRVIAGILLGIGFIVGLYGTFVQSTACPLNGTDCVVDLQSVYAGFCSSSGDAAIVKLNGRYVLTAPANTPASGTCVNLVGFLR
jgi:hypothetical protein